MKAQKESACIMCDEVITNPICPECVGRGIKTWLRGVKPQIVSEVKMIIENLKMFELPQTKCVICQKTMCVCPHCSSKEILELIQHENDDEMEQEFITLFDWDMVEREYYL